MCEGRKISRVASRIARPFFHNLQWTAVPCEVINRITSRCSAKICAKRALKVENFVKFVHLKKSVNNEKAEKKAIGRKECACVRAI
jgi:hypothetical protein